MKNCSFTYVYYDTSLEMEAREEFATWEEFVEYAILYIETAMSAEECAEFWNLVYDAMTYTTDTHILIDLS